MKIYLIAALAALFLAFGISTTHAQDNLIYGTWRYDDPVNEGANFYVGFYPQGVFYMPFYEGSATGRFSISGNQLVLDGTFEYVEASDFYEVYTYSVGVNTLSLSSNNGTQTLRRMSFYTPPPSSCPGTLPHQLFVGLFGQVTFTDGTATRMRSGPGTEFNVEQSMEEGRRFAIVGGPVCDGDKTWWQINTLHDDKVGWATEGVGYYYIEPDRFMGDIIANPPPVNAGQILTNAGADPYGPGQYPNGYELEVAVGKLPEAGLLVNLSNLALFVMEVPSANGLDVICALVTLDDTITGSGNQGNQVTCLIYDTVTAAIVGNPISGTAFMMAEITANPDIYIDPWLDDVNAFTDSLPMTRLYCYLTGSDCSAVFGR